MLTLLVMLSWPLLLILLVMLRSPLLLMTLGHHIYVPYLGGTEDRTVLTCYRTHVAKALWDAKAVTVYKYFNIFNNYYTF